MTTRVTARGGTPGIPKPRHRWAAPDVADLHLSEDMFVFGLLGVVELLLEDDEDRDVHARKVVQRQHMPHHVAHRVVA